MRTGNLVGKSTLDMLRHLYPSFANHQLNNTFIKVFKDCQEAPDDNLSR